MNRKSILTIFFLASMMFSGLFVSSANANVDVYVTQGQHHVNGREWRTDCEKYSQSIDRCRTEIRAKQITRVNNKFVETNGWVFNNLTYKPVARSTWGTNPLANTKSWVADDGRKWRTECDTALTGKNGCRSFTIATVYSKRGASVTQETKWVFNNMVRFMGSGAAIPPAPLECASTPSGGKAIYVNTKAEDCIFAAINKDRAASGRQPIARDSRLQPVAEKWTVKMASASKLTNFVHNPKVWDEMGRALGWRGPAAENVAYAGSTGNVASSDIGKRLHQSLMGSPPHRKNILDDKFDIGGVSVVCRTSDSTCFVTQNFSDLTDWNGKVHR